MPVNVLVIEPISKRPSNGQLSLRRTAYPPSSAATAAMNAAAGGVGPSVSTSPSTVVDRQFTR